jgi:hypothetical protein
MKPGQKEVPRRRSALCLLDHKNQGEQHDR